MASPHVAGAAALLLSAVPGLTAYQIRTALVSGADATTVRTSAGQKGLLNLTGALTYQQTHATPSEPTQYTEYDKAYDNGGGGGSDWWSSSSGGCDTAGIGALLLLLAMPWCLNVRRRKVR